MASGIFFDADGNDETMEVLTQVIKRDEELDTEIAAVAEDIIQYKTGGQCHLGKLCGICDCFLTQEKLDADTEFHLDFAEYLLRRIEERHGTH